MKQYKIYKITNLLDDKIYIGCTGYSLKKRFRQHVNARKPNKICLALRKYGEENFTI